MTFISSIICCNNSLNASTISEEYIFISLGSPLRAFLPLISIEISSSSSTTAPICFLISSAVFSPIKRLCFCLIYSIIVVSNLSPATLKDEVLTTPPKEMTANSDVPPPISTIIFPSGSKIFSPIPIAAAIGSSTRYASLAPASLVTSITALFST